MSGFYKIRVDNDNGESLILESTDRGYLLSEVDLGDVAETDNTAKIPYIDGEQYGGMRMGVRDITIKGHCFNGDFARMERAFSPFSGVTLTLHRERTYYTIRGKPYGVCKCNRNPPYDFTVQFRCFDPFFYGEEVNIPGIAGSKAGKETVLYNQGDAPTPIRMRIGYATKNNDYTLQLAGTSKKLEIKEMPKSYTSVWIDTTPGACSITGDGEDLTQYLTWDSEFFLLPAGRNIICFRVYNDVAAELSASAYGYFRPRYLVI